jgi:hypothetical protein
LVRTFGEPTPDEYPAPYRWEDAKQIAEILLKAGDEAAPVSRVHYDHIRERFKAIERSALPNWRKTYAVIMVVVVPMYSANLLWWWYRPRLTIKELRFNAIISWAALFFTLPNTASAAAGITAGIAGSSLVPNMATMLDPNRMIHRGDLDLRQMRQALYDVYRYMNSWNRMSLGEKWEGMLGLQATERLAELNMKEIAAAYPLSDPDQFVFEGNFRVVDQIVWLANTKVQAAINVNFDEGAAWGTLVLRVVATAIAAIAPQLSPAMAAAVRTAEDAITAIASIIMSGGHLSQAQMQALGGAGAAYLLDQAAIRLGLDDELSDIESAYEQVTGATG